MEKVKKTYRSCSKCGKVFTQRQNLYRHNLNCIKNVNFSCNKCLKSFSRKDYFKSHKVKCRDKIEVHCNIYNRDFISNWHLKRHIAQLHSKETVSFKCSNCNKTYTRKTFYDAHVQSCRIHTVKTRSKLNGSTDDASFGLNEVENYLNISYDETTSLYLQYYSQVFICNITLFKRFFLCRQIFSYAIF